MGSDAGDKYAVTALGGTRSKTPGQLAALPGMSPGRDVEAGGLDKDSIMKFYKKRTILPQEKLGAAADLKRNTKDMGFAQDDFRLDPEEVAFLRTLKEEYANRRRWRCWHKTCLVIFIELVFIFFGAVYTQSWFNIKPMKDGVQSDGAVIGAGLVVSDAHDDQHVLVHSGTGEATMELRAAGAGSLAGIVLSGEKIPGRGSDRFSISAPDAGHFTIAQGGTSRFKVDPLEANDGDVDIELDPGQTGEVTVHDDVSIGAAHIRTRSSNLTVEAANNSDVRLVTDGNGTVRIHSRNTVSDGSVEVAGTCLVGGDTMLGSSLHVGSDMSVGRDSSLDGLLTVGGESTFSSHVTVSGRLDVNSEAVLRQNVQARSLEVVDRLDASGHMFIGTSNMDQLYIQSHISSRTLIFDEDHSFAQTGAGSLQIEFPDPARNERISFPEETGTVLTTMSPISQLERVGTLTGGSIAEGFGGAHIAWGEVTGPFITHSDVNLGDSDFDLIRLTGRMTNEILVFDADADGVALTVKFPDPTSSYQGNYIEFPDGESGTVLTTVSPVSSLEEVGALVNGSIVEGFGSAHVQSLISSTSSHLRGDSIIGSRREDELYISAHISSPSMFFDADSDGQGMQVVFPDNENRIVTFPNETGTVLTTDSDLSTLKHVSGLLSGSLEPGFGSATVASLHSTGDTSLDADVSIGLSTEESLTIRATIRTQDLVFDANADGTNVLTVSFPDPAGPETISFPAETGQLLTTVSLSSSLTSVGILAVGELGDTFGDASVASLVARGNSVLRHDVDIGTNLQDKLAINGHITSSNLVFDADSTGGRMSFSFPDPLVDRTIRVPDEDGDMLTSSSRDSVLTSVGALVAGSIGGDFGDIIVDADIRSLDPTGVLATAGDLLVDGSATLGDHFSDEISVRGHFTIKNNGQRVFDVNPEMGDTQIEGNLQVAGVIRTDSAFGVAEMEVATINEFELDGGVTIAGVLIRDGGILHTKIDRVDELEDGHGVTIDGVVMKNGAVITESATGTTAKGEVDMIRIINTGHDADMDETTTNIKFRQTYHDLTGAEEHEESDMVKISAVTESDWTQREDSRSAYFKVSVVNSGEMEERLRLTAEGDMLLNTDSFIVDGPTGDTLIHGNLLVTSRDGTDEREIAITSSANTAGLRIEAGDSAAGTMLIKGGATGNAEATLMGGDDMDASLTFADPSATDGASYSILVDGSSNFMQITGSITSAAAAGRRTQVSTDVLATFKPVQESTNLNGVTHTYDSLVGAVDVTGELTAENCDIRGDMVAGTLASLGNTRLGRNSSDSITIPGRFAQPYLLVDAGGDAAATCTGTADDTDATPDCMTAFISAADSLGRHDYTAASCPPGCTYSRGGILNITFPEGTEPHTIGFPSESGEVITTSSNFSTLQAVGDVSEGNIVEGFGKAEVNSLVSVTGTELRGGVSIGNSTDNPIAVHGFITTDHLVFDADVDGDCLMLMFQDPATDYTYQGELIQLDIVVVDTERPQDLSWELVRDETQEVVASGVGQVLLQGGINGATVFLLPNGQHYTFTITDSYGDGIWKQAADDGVQVSMNGIELGSASRLTGFGGNVPINTPVTWSVEIQAGKPEDETQAFCEAQTLTPGDPLSCTGTAPEYVGVCSAICVGTANDAAATPDCRTAFNLASDTTAASCPDGCTYAPEGSHSNMAACTANSGVWISYRCTYTPNDPVTVENEEACNAEIIPVPPASLTGAGTVDPEYTGQWLIEEDCTAIDPDIADDVARCDLVDISGEDAVADRQSCTNTGGGGVCQYIAAVAGHCSQDKTNVVRFPQEDGTLIAMHQGTTTTTYLDGNVPADVSVRATGTYLGGKVYLGTENSDQVMFPGQIDGKLQYAASSVIVGGEAMHFGATTYGVEQHYEICEPRYKDACAGVVMDGDEAANQVACEAVVRVGTQLSACTYTPSGGSVDETCTAEAATRCAAADISDYRGSVVAEACAAIDPDVPADVTTCGIVDISGNNAFEDSKSCTNAGGGGICQYTAAVDGKSELACEGSDEAARECTYLPGGGDAYTSAFKLTLGVPPLIDDLSLTLPHENGVLLSTTSEVSTLKEVGDLSFLTVDGPTLCNADLTIGDAASDKLTFVSAVHGTDAMSFDGGFAPDPTITNVAEHKPVLASTHDEDETEPDKRTAHLAVDGDMGPWLVPGHGIEHMWMSANTYPYHWLAIDLQNAYDITGMEIWGANPDGTAGDLCDYSLLYRPFTMGVTNEDFSAVVSSLRTDYNDFVNDAGSLTTLWKGLASTPRWSGTAEGWQVAFDSSTIRANMDHSYGSHTFPSVKAMHVRVDISMDAGCREDNGLGSTAAAIISEVYIMGVDVRPLTTMGVVQPTQDRRIVLPDESGTVLTDTSTFSSLTTVGALSSGSLVTGFGPATIDNGLTSSGNAFLQGDVTLGDSNDDSIYVRGSLVGQQLTDYAADFNDHITVPGSVPAWPTDGQLKYGSFVEIDVDRTNDFELKLALIDPSADRTITFPDETGEVLTTSSQSSALTTVSELVAGSIGVGFGDISIGDPANPTTASQTLTVVGLADFQQDVNLGVDQDDTININGKIANDAIVFKSDTGSRAGVVTLDINRPALATTERTIVFPDWDPIGGVSRTLATTEDSSMSNLATVGALESGSIVAGFGSITTGDAGGISTTGSAPVSSAGALTASAELVMNGMEFFTAIDGISETVPAGKSTVRVSGSAGVNLFTLVLPTLGPNGGPLEVGQTVILKNDNSNQILVDKGTGTEGLAAGAGGVFMYVGAGLQWVQFV
eukprot:COSAG02_NODE_542_length_20590_cov_9.193060_7_plen_2783_part_00